MFPYTGFGPSHKFTEQEIAENQAITYELLAPTYGLIQIVDKVREKLLQMNIEQVDELSNMAPEQIVATFEGSNIN